jgi:hypothetical protein
MKTIISKSLACLFALLASLSVLSAGNSADFEGANRLFQSGDFAGAAAVYQQRLNTGGPSAALLYNLGNSQYRLGQYGPAILSYERAKLLAPRDPDLLANHQLACKAATVFDKGRFPPSLEAVLTWLSLNEWSWLLAGAALWIGTLSLLTGVVRISRSGPRRLLAGSMVLAGLIIVAGSAALFLRRDEGSRGVVLSKDAAVHLSPFEKAEVIGTPGAGRIVRLGEKSGGYFYVDVPGTELHGWISERDVASIYPM